MLQEWLLEAVADVEVEADAMRLLLWLQAPELLDLEGASRRASSLSSSDITAGAGTAVCLADRYFLHALGHR
jgi:hypothetical protein